MTQPIAPDEAAALHRLLDAYLATEEGDPGIPALRRLRERVAGMRQDHSAYVAYFGEQDSSAASTSLEKPQP